jgi:hypothetical protein
MSLSQFDPNETLRHVGAPSRRAPRLRAQTDFAPLDFFTTQPAPL